MSLRAFLCSPAELPGRDNAAGTIMRERRDCRKRSETMFRRMEYAT
ncbi:hypothetical protein [Paractinoplanes durhamensis]|uniref:Uncharacterized protein n=1 Tax=Paractinoplanes durhamensis TaxID=113563 RepID=A0ABQ3YUA0_9ACTN|nr:hypothetical protein [Actinoplanes durhamensis]GIE00914.1 hypothetical protein Adu01nite_22640 [Actinoplanes durhamensis]